MEDFKFEHVSVLLNEVCDYLDPKETDVIIDGTLGLGGHTKELMKRSDGQARAFCFDLDSRNLRIARDNLRRFDGRVSFINDNFSSFDHYYKVMKMDGVDKVVLDLGLSSPHLDIAEHGFSFKKRGPLDMRYSRKQKITAATLINKLPADQLAMILKSFGELSNAKLIARKIVEERAVSPFKYTDEFATRIEVCFHPKDRVKGLTCVFQAIRIAVNDELRTLSRGLESLYNHLSSNGRIAVISYHSLEDRIVKNFFRKLEKPLETDPEKSLKSIYADPLIEMITKKPIKPGEKEIEVNPRARSAKLRVIRKI